jgi:Cys-rich protein (TIGR01571 family)
MQIFPDHRNLSQLNQASAHVARSIPISANTIVPYEEIRSVQVCAIIPGLEFGRIGAWQHSLFSCLQQIMPSCIMSFFCPCILLPTLLEKMRIMKSYSFIFISTILFFLCIYASSYITNFSFLILYIYLSITAFYLRIKLRNHFTIPGATLNDFIFSFVCLPCVLSQVI